MTDEMKLRKRAKLITEERKRKGLPNSEAYFFMHDSISMILSIILKIWLSFQSIPQKFLYIPCLPDIMR